MIREDLCRMCEELLCDLEPEHTVEVFASAEELSQLMETGETFDLLCLDILMDGKTGMELAHELRERDDRTDFLFLTSSEQHLKEGYSVRPIQYLFKPVQREELAQALKTSLRLRSQPKVLALRFGGKTTVFSIERILYLESQNHSLHLNTIDGAYTFYITLSEAERQLPAARFCRCHNSYLVNLGQVAEIGRAEVVLSDGTRLPVSRRCYDTLQQRLVGFLNHA